MKTIQQSILDFYKKQEFQKLNSYYMQSTVFDVLGVQRSENRHSAFLAWLLNPNASHSLKELPLRKFLALIAAKADNEDKCFYDQVRLHLLSGNYQLRVDCVKTEQSIIGLANERMSDLEGIVEKTEGFLLGRSSSVALCERQCTQCEDVAQGRFRASYQAHRR